MSKPWKPELIDSGRRLQFTRAELGLTLLAGIIVGAGGAGLSIAFRPTIAEVNFGAAPVPDYWTESKRSKQIMEGQEGTPDGSTIVFAETDASAGPAIRVIDGDTFRLAGQTIRIADIDTPETRGRCAEETELAAQATARMSELLHDGAFQLHPVDRDADRYGRKLRIVTRNGRSLGDQLVAEGLARTWTGRREPWCA